MIFIPFNAASRDFTLQIPKEPSRPDVLKSEIFPAAPRDCMHVIVFWCLVETWVSEGASVPKLTLVLNVFRAVLLDSFAKWFFWSSSEVNVHSPRSLEVKRRGFASSPTATTDFSLKNSNSRMGKYGNLMR